MEVQDSDYLNQYFEKAKNWKEEMILLRNLCLNSKLNEEKKWWQPVYTLDGKNICIIGQFKDFCTLSFFKGSLLKDDKKLLVFPGLNSRVAKLFKFTSLQEIQNLESEIKDYLKEAIALEKAGAKIPTREKTEVEFPEVLTSYLSQDSEYQKAFTSLTPGRQRAYILQINSAKQEETKIKRIQSFREKILLGKGPNDR